MIKLKALFFLFVMLMLPAAGQAKTMMTLQQCLTYGLENSPYIKAADYGVAAVEESRKSARADFLPSVSTSYNFNRLENERAKGYTDTDYLNQYIRSFAVNMSQILYAGNRVINAYDKAKLDLERQRADKRLAVLEVTYNIQSTFFQLMGAKQELKIAHESVNRLEAGVTSAKAYLEKSLISYSEVLTAEVDLADARQRLSKAENDVNRKRVALFSLMDHPMSSDIEFQGGEGYFPQAYPDEFEACWKVAKKNRPDLDSLAKQVAMAQKDAETAKGSYLPLVKLDLSYNDMNRDYDALENSRVDRDQRNRYWSAGVNATWSLFDGGRNWYNSRKSLLDAARIREDIKRTQLSIREKIRKALFSIKEAEFRARVTQKAVEAAQQSYKVENRRMEAGLATIPQVLDAQMRLTRAQGNNTQAQLDYLLGRSELEFMLGQPQK